MEGEPVDRRGLLRDMFRQAANAVAPAIAPAIALARTPAAPAESHARGALAVQAATGEQLRSAATELGLGGRLAAIEAFARRSMRLMPSAHGGSDAVSFGGQALMNEGQEWPSWQGRPLTLLAQVDTGGPLGRLLFFYDTVGRPTGCLAAHSGAARVVQASDGRLLAHDGPAQPQGTMSGVVAQELVLPRVYFAAVETLELSQAERDSWQALREELARIQGTDLTDRPGAVFTVVHRLFGYPDNTGGEMPLTCELACAGEDIIEGRAHLHPRAQELEAASGRWELLAQFSGDGKLGWPWVAQRVYFWIDRDALGRGELGDVWAIAR